MWSNLIYQEFSDQSKIENPQKQSPPQSEADRSKFQVEFLSDKVIPLYECLATFSGSLNERVMAQLEKAKDNHMRIAEGKKRKQRV